jgi:hypothetical protein
MKKTKFLNKLIMSLSMFTIFFGVPSVFSSYLDIDETDKIVTITPINHGHACVSNSGATVSDASACNGGAWDEIIGYGLPVEDYDYLLNYLTVNPNTSIIINGYIEDVR